MESAGLYNQNQLILNVTAKVNRNISLTGSYPYNGVGGTEIAEVVVHPSILWEALVVVTSIVCITLAT
jgi:hypothetical protein